jgi:hypothetical protein
LLAVFVGFPELSSVLLFVHFLLHLFPVAHQPEGKIILPTNENVKFEEFLCPTVFSELWPVNAGAYLYAEFHGLLWHIRENHVHDNIVNMKLMFNVHMARRSSCFSVNQHEVNGDQSLDSKSYPKAKVCNPTSHKVLEQINNFQHFNSSLMLMLITIITTNEREQDRPSAEEIVIKLDSANDDRDNDTAMMSGGSVCLKIEKGLVQLGIGLLFLFFSIRATRIKWSNFTRLTSLPCLCLLPTIFPLWFRHNRDTLLYGLYRGVIATK